MVLIRPVLLLLALVTCGFGFSLWYLLHRYLRHLRVLLS
jgi:hypothetical protein